MPTERIVVDVSAVAGLVLPDEALGNLTTALAGAEAVAPRLLRAEIRNLLLMAERRRRIGSGDLEQALAILDAVGVEYDAEPSSDRTLQLARRHNLTAYDALYLELALRLGAPLASSDRALARAAEAEGVALI